MLNYALTIVNYKKTLEVILNTTRGGGVGIWECVLDPIKRFPYTITTEMFNASCSVEGLIVKFVVTGTLCALNTGIRKLVEFEEFIGCVVKLSVYKVDPLYGQNSTKVFGDVYIGVTESMIVRAIENHVDAYECELTIGNFDSITNFVMDYSGTMPRAYGVGYFYTPAYAGLIAAKHSYYIGENSVAGVSSGSRASLVNVYDGGLSVLVGATSTQTTISLTLQPTRELRVITNHVGTVMSMSTPQSDNIVWFPLEYFKLVTSLNLYTYDSGIGTIEAFGVNTDNWSITSLGSLINITFVGGVGYNIFGVGKFTYTTFATYLVIGLRVTITNPVCCYTKMLHVTCSCVAPLLFWLNSVLIDNLILSNSVTHTRYAIDSRSICDIYLRFRYLEVSYPIEKGAKINFREVLDAIANTVNSFVVCTSYAVVIKSLKYSSGVALLPFQVVAGKTQIAFDRPPMTGKWKIGYNKKGGGGCSDLAGTVVATTASWMRESQDFYIGAASSPSVPINPYMCSIMTADTLAVNKTPANTPLPAFDLINMVVYQNRSLYKLTLYTYDVINAIGCNVGTTYILPSGILPFTASLATFIITSNDAPYWWDSNYHPHTLVEIKGDLYI